MFYCLNSSFSCRKLMFFFFFSSRRRHTRLQGDWSSDVCSSDLSMRWLGLAREGQGQALRAEARHPDTGETYSLQVLPHVASNNQLSIQQMCEAGLGLALLGSMDVADTVAEGRLVRLLPDRKSVV